jgi:hypothetical protein
MGYTPASSAASGCARFRSKKIREPPQNEVIIRYLDTTLAVLFYLLRYSAVFVIFIPRASHLFDLIPDFD